MYAEWEARARVGTAAEEKVRKCGIQTRETKAGTRGVFETCERGAQEDPTADSELEYKKVRQAVRGWRRRRRRTRTAGLLSSRDTFLCVPKELSLRHSCVAAVFASDKRMDSDKKVFPRINVVEKRRGDGC